MIWAPFDWPLATSFHDSWVDKMKVSEAQIESFASSVLSILKVSPEQLKSVVRNIVWNELDGRKNFGLQRLPTYVARLMAGGINPSASPQITRLAGASTNIDGDNGFGQYAGEVAMAEAIKSAQEFGISISTVRQSNFFGSGAYFVNQACEAGMIGFAMSNSFPKVAAHEGKRAVLGTNPFAFGAPAANGGEMIADFATSSLAGSTVRDYLDRNEPLPPDAIAGEAEGDKITLTPFGGAKGFSISLLVEILSGVLSGSGISAGVNSMYEDLTKPGENGHALMAINIAAWSTREVFLERMQLLRKIVIDDGTRLPGENRAKQRARRKVDGVDISENTMSELNQIAQTLDVKRLQNC